MGYILKLNITIDRKSAMNVEADVLDSDHFSKDATPETIEGALFDATPAKIQEFRSANHINDINVGYLGTRYRFVRLEEDGRFQLRKWAAG